MKYWLFQSNQVLGPFDRDELANTAGFSAESLVCPEGRKGTQMGDWQRAGVMAELAETLLKMARVPAGAAAGGGGSGFLPPEPTLRDLAVLGTLQEKVSLLENSLSSLHEELRAREEEISGLKVELSQKSTEAAELQSKVGDLEVKLSAAESLRDEINLTKEAQAGEAKTVEDLKSQLDAVRSELQSTVSRMEETQEKLRSDLSSRIDSVRSAGPGPARPAPAPLPGPAAAPVLPPIGGAPDVSLSIPEPTPFAPPAPDSGPALEAPVFGGPDAPALEPPPIDFGGPTPAPVPLDAPPPLDLGAPPILDTPLPQTMAGGAFDAPAANPFGSTPTPLPMPGAAPLFGPDTGTAPAPAASDAAVDLMAPEAKPKRRKGPLIALAVLVLAGGGLGGAWKMGLLDAQLKQFGLAKGGAAPAPATTKPEPAPEPAPAPDPQVGLPDRTTEALDLAKAYPIPRLAKNLAQVLEASAPGDGLVSPWNVKPVGEGRYEVTFYGKPGRADYTYEVRLDSKEVRGLNAKSQAVLDGKAPAPAKAAAEAPRRKGRYSEGGEAPAPRAKAPRANAKAASEALSEDPLGALLLESSVSEAAPAEKPKARRPRRAAKPAEEAPAPELSLDPPADEAPAEEEAPAPKRRRAAKPAKSDEELTLDELLLPGVPKR